MRSPGVTLPIIDVFSFRLINEVVVATFSPYAAAALLSFILLYLPVYRYLSSSPLFCLSFIQDGSMVQLSI